MSAILAALWAAALGAQAPRPRASPDWPAVEAYATDTWQRRARGVRCVGIGAGVDVEDQVRGYGMHSDQERLLESGFQRLVRLNWGVVTRLARTPQAAAAGAVTNPE